MANTGRAENILHIYESSSSGLDDNQEYQKERKACRLALKILGNAPSAELYDNIKTLSANLSDTAQIFFSEDGKTALITEQKDGHDLFVRLTADEYSTGGGKIHWATMKRGTNHD